MLKSNGLPRPKIRLKKFDFSSKTVPANIAKKLPSQRCSQPLFNFSHKRLTFAFTGESGYTLGFQRKIAHKGTHGETGGVLDGGGITTLGAFRTFTNIPGPGIRTASFAAFGSWSGVLPKNAKSLRDSDALMRVAVPRRRGPAGLRDLFRFCRNCGLYALRSGPFRVCEARGGITLEMSRNVQSGNTQNLKSSAASDQAAVCACARSRYFAGGSPSGLRV